MAADADAFLATWHEIVASRDLAGLRRVLADDIALGAPPYWTRLEGVDLVCHLLGLVITTIEGFTYHREWRSGSELALEFTGRVGDKDLQGVDLISLDDDNKVKQLEVPMRPVNAVVALQRAIAPGMEAFLSRKG
jgi:hypothetical protein